ncbi:MAG: MBL fold metallo-hydrolase [Phycisphaerales bacterium]|nr:MBL fold metallo-hydrolase [Phycisphaerales bacterium]
MTRKPIALLMFLSASALVRAQDLTDVKIVKHHVAGNIHMLEGRGGNIGVSVGNDGLLIIDDQFAPLAGRIRAALRELNPGELKFILNTHWHGDHTGGNVEFGPEAPIIAHTNVRKRLSTPQELFGRTVEPLPEVGLPVITFDASLSVHFNGEEIRAWHLPGGHTDGDIVVYFTSSNVLHTGDLFFNGMFPFVDLDHGGNVEGVARNVAMLIEKTPKDAKIIPGHGPIGSIDDLKRFQGMLVETSAMVRERIQAGKSLDEVKTAGLPAQWDSWGTGFIKTDQWLELTYKSLKP